MEQSNSTQSPEQAAIAALGQVDNPGLSQDQENDPEKKAPESVKIDFDKVAETERRLFKERKKWGDKTKQMEARIKELEAKLNESSKKPESSEPGEPEDESDFSRLFEETPLTKEEFARMKAEEEKSRQESEDQEMRRLELEYQQSKVSKRTDEFIKTNSEKFPLVAEKGDSELILEVLGQDYDQKVEEFGEEYAQKNIMSMENACQIAEKYLESQIETMLKSEKISKLVKAKLGLTSQDDSSQYKEPRTLSNENFESSSSHGELSEDERIRRAMAAMS